jgi:S-adenosylmethionine hydrolase
MIITLTSDFGLSDPFVGIMKGVIFGIVPGAQIVDISHDIRSYDIVEAAFLIDSAYGYFPEGTIHVVVVDPGVGSARRPIAASAGGHLFVAPDNGVLSAVFDKDERSECEPDRAKPSIHERSECEPDRAKPSIHERSECEPDRAKPSNYVYHITNRSLFLDSVSQTFHGRDIFSPVAAHLARGTPIESVGPRILDFLERPLPKPRPQGDKTLATVLRIDKFGNIITNLRRRDLSGDFTIRVAGLAITRLCSSFSEAARGEFFAIEGSTGLIELALDQGSAADKLRIGRGAEIEVESTSSNH